MKTAVMTKLKKRHMKTVKGSGFRTIMVLDYIREPGLNSFKSTSLHPNAVAGDGDTDASDPGVSPRVFC